MLSPSPLAEASVRVWHLLPGAGDVNPAALGFHRTPVGLVTDAVSHLGPEIGERRKADALTSRLSADRDRLAASASPGECGPGTDLQEKSGLVPETGEGMIRVRRRRLCRRAIGPS